MSLILDGTNGLSDIDGSAATPAIRGTDANTGIFFPAADTIAFSEGGVESMRIDASGNMGQKVTPSPWATYSVLQQANGSLASVGTQTQVIQNAYFDGSNMRYITSNGASRYGQDVFGGATHYWYNAPSGTAGNVITFTQTMTLKQDGNNTYVNFGCTGLADAAQLYTGFSSTSSYFAIGTKVSGTLAERVRIDSSGNFLINTTANNGRLTVSSPCNTVKTGFAVINTDAGAGTFVGFINSAGNTAGSITQSGTTTVLYNTSSDQRLKQNIQDSDSASNLIDALQVRKYDWKSDGQHQRYGFVAQELVTVAPEAVYQPNDTEEMMSVDYSKLVPMLVKEIQSLRKRLADAGIA